MGYPVIDGVDTRERRFEWDIDDNPIYLGTAEKGTLASGIGWNITKLTWSSDNVIHMQHRIGIWNDRATLDWL